MESNTPVKKAGASLPSVGFKALLDNPQFIAAIAERVRQYPRSGKRGRKAT